MNITALLIETGLMPTDSEPYMLKDVAKMMGVSRNTAEKLFEAEPGVLVLGRPEELHKRRYRTIRVPQHVYERVLRRLTV